MFNQEVRSLVFEVIRSWQVIAATVAIVIYIILVKYVARTHSRRWPRSASVRKAKKEMAEVVAPSGDDGLGLEEKEEL